MLTWNDKIDELVKHYGVNISELHDAEDLTYGIKISILVKESKGCARYGEEDVVYHGLNIYCGSLPSDAALIFNSFNGKPKLILNTREHFKALSMIEKLFKDKALEKADVIAKRPEVLFDELTLAELIMQPMIVCRNAAGMPCSIQEAESFDQYCLGGLSQLKLENNQLYEVALRGGYSYDEKSNKVKPLNALSAYLQDRMLACVLSNGVAHVKTYKATEFSKTLQ